MKGKGRERGQHSDWVKGTFALWPSRSLRKKKGPPAKGTAGKSQPNKNKLGSLVHRLNLYREIAATGTTFPSERAWIAGRLKSLGVKGGLQKMKRRQPGVIASAQISNNRSSGKPKSTALLKKAASYRRDVTLTYEEK